MFGIDDIISGVIGLGKSYIDDKAKQVEFAEETMKLGFQLQEHILTMQTSPKVDGLVKLMYAFKEMVIPLMRPVVSAALSGFAAYAAYKHIDLGPLNTILGASFPGWMSSRALEKLTSKDK